MTIADLAPLALRASLGFFFFASGWRKTFNPDTHAHIVGLFARLRVSDRLVWVICVSELLGGLALLLGFLTPIAAIGLIIILCGAIKLTCWQKICDKGPHTLLTFWPACMMEPEIVMVVALIALAVIGAGPLSADHLLSEALTYVAQTR